MAGLLGSALRGALRPRASLRCWQQAAVALVALDALLWIAAMAADAIVQPASRRLCNLAYALWVMGQVTSQPRHGLPAVTLILPWHLQVMLALGFCLLATALGSAAPSTLSGAFNARPIAEAVNAHPLAVFLVANLLTGAINLGGEHLGWPPALMSTAAAASILGVYMAAVCGTALLLDQLGSLDSSASRGEPLTRTSGPGGMHDAKNA